MKSAEDITEWVKSETAREVSINDDTSLQELGVYGDDWHELMTAYAERFGVDISNYLWYFHMREEAPSLGGLFFPPPNRRVQQIAVTVGMLKEFAEAGEWKIEYPDHHVPKKRYDLLINKYIFGVATLALVIFCIWKYLW